MRRLIIPLAVALWLMVAPKAYAFHEFGNWLSAPESASPGGGALFATGGTRDYGLTCAQCHSKAPGLVDIMLTPNPAWVQKAGSNAYLPNTSYTITVKLLNEAKGLTPKAGAINYNSFMLTVENQSGQAAGTYTNDNTPKVTTANCTTPPVPTTIGTTLLVGPPGMQCYTVMARPTANLTSWTFTWISPAAGSGPLVLYYGLVDGDASASSLGDDVKVGSLKLVEGP